MAKKKKTEVQEEALETTAEVQEEALETPGLDPLDPASGMFIKMPTSHERAFVAKAKMFGIEGRLGDGPCTVLKKFMLPNGDIILKDDTFNPLVERMTAAKYRRLLVGKFFTKATAEVEEELLKR